MIGRLGFCRMSATMWLVFALVILLLMNFLMRRRPLLGDSTPPDPQGTYDISATFDVPGLGNLLFQYASLVGIAERSHMRPVVPSSCVLYQVFSLPTLESSASRPGNEWGKVLETKASSFDRMLAKLDFHHNIELVGFLQSWMYFEHIQDEIRQQHLIFKPDLKHMAYDVLRLYLDTPDVLFIGVHIRRGDFTSERFQALGYTVADRAYLYAATLHYAHAFPNNSLVYIVSSDDLHWSRENFQPHSGRTVFSEGRTASQDLALLSHCNHSIITVGTFGWWAGWLAGGKVTYYWNFPQNNSRLAIHAFSTERKDYYPRMWVAL